MSKARRGDRSLPCVLCTTSVRSQSAWVHGFPKSSFFTLCQTTGNRQPHLQRQHRHSAVPQYAQARMVVCMQWPLPIQKTCFWRTVDLPPSALSCQRCTDGMGPGVCIVPRMRLACVCWAGRRLQSGGWTVCPNATTTPKLGPRLPCPDHFRARKTNEKTENGKVGLSFDKKRSLVGLHLHPTHGQTGNSHLNFATGKIRHLNVCLQSVFNEQKIWPLKPAAGRKMPEVGDQPPAVGS